MCSINFHNWTKNKCPEKVNQCRWNRQSDCTEFCVRWPNFDTKIVITEYLSNFFFNKRKLLRNLNSLKFLQSQAEQPIFNFRVQFFSSAQNLKPAAIISAKFENDVAPSSVSTPNKSCPSKKYCPLWGTKRVEKFFIILRRRKNLKIRVERRRLLIWRAVYCPNATACVAYSKVI